MDSIDNEYIDRPDVEDVLQEETGLVAVPVRINDIVRVDQLPNELAVPRTVVIGIGQCKQLCGHERRRSRVTIIVFNNDVMIGTRHMSRNDEGAFIPAGIPVPIHLSATDALWARPVSASTNGTDITFGEAADSAAVTVLEERWAR